MLMTAVFIAAGCSKPDEPNNGGDNNGGNNNDGNGGGTINHEYVDLGLPSGTLWATCNVGATTPEGYGDYFAWGETTPKTTYNWGTYKYGNGDEWQLTKYCNISYFGYNGYSDSLNILQSTDDAAFVNWSSDARMPTKEEWQELEGCCASVWTTQNNVSGRLFTGSNGNVVFMPAAGGYWGDEVSDDVWSGHYWSSSLYTVDDPAFAWDFHFSSGDAGVGCGSRSGGFSVRPVRSSR